ncbi:MAG: excisionase family DNA-binding protein [Candidatus Melainabacteria bacterium]|nr:excisionase family DNA-binding protein [Candidatus Melainabacteria bacterium]
MAITLDNTEPFALSPEDASELARELPTGANSPAFLYDQPCQRKFTISGDGVTIEIPDAVFKFLLGVLEQMAHGNPVLVASVDSELSTQKAADLLNVSRPYLIGLLDQYEIPYRNVGRYRRVKLQDIMTLKKRLEQDEDQALTEMLDESQQLEMPY